jgi:serine/threonine-protein kinase
MPKAKAAARKAVQLDDTLSDAHTRLGLAELYFDWDWKEAEKELKRAIELNPNSAMAHLLFEDYLLALGQTDDALQETRRSIELDPLSTRVLTEAQFAYLLAGQSDQAIGLGTRLAEIEPGLGISHVWSGLGYVEKGDLSRAVSEMDAAVRTDPNPTTRAFLAHVRALAGDRAGAKRIIEELTALSSHGYVCPFELGTAYIGLGMKREAYQWLQRGFDDRSDCMVWLKSEPWLKSLRNDREFEALARDVGFPN